MGRTWESVFFAGLLILTFILVVLFSRPAASPRGAYINIDTALTGGSGNVRVAKLKMSLNDQQQLDNFPYIVGEHRGGDISNVAGVQSYLGAETLLMRSYTTTEKWTQPIFLVLVYSSKSSSLHPPPLCYRMQGYKVLQESIEAISVRDSALAERIEGKSGGSISDWISGKLGLSQEEVEIRVNRMVVEKTDDTGGKDRRLVFYVYLKDMEFVRYEYCLVRISGIIPTSGGYADIETGLSSFMSATLAQIFEGITEENQTVFNIIVDFGLKGFAALAILIAIPSLMIIYPLAARKVFTRVIEETPAVTGVEDETGTARETYRAPYEMSGKSPEGRILAAYYNCQDIIERLTGIPAAPYPTLREFLDKVGPLLPLETAGRFRELVVIAEAAMYSSSVYGENEADRAVQLAGQIIDELDEMVS